MIDINSEIDSASQKIHKMIGYYGYGYGYGITLTNLVMKYRPNRIYEFGSGTGYTTLHLALGCHFNKFGSVTTHDVFQTKSVGIFKPHPIEKFKKHIQAVPQLSSLIHSNICDYNDWLLTNDNNFDFIYFDVNNDGDKIIDIFNKLKTDSNKGKVLVFEGGHPNRNNSKYSDVTPIYDSKVKELTNYSLEYNSPPGIIKIIL
jgi:SAM-dependent methyltransferase